MTIELVRNGAKSKIDQRFEVPQNLDQLEQAVIISVNIFLKLLSVGDNIRPQFQSEMLYCSVVKVKCT